MYIKRSPKCVRIKAQTINSHTRKESLMINSILQFEDQGLLKLEKITESFIESPEKMAEYVSGVQDVLVNLGCALISETFQSCNDMLRKSVKRKTYWDVVRTDSKTMITSMGDIHFEKTLFKNKETGKTAYLIDQVMHLEPHMRISEDAEAKLLEEAVETSYKKAAKALSIKSEVSRETVKDKIHNLTFNHNTKEAPVKKKVDYLYIDADEDHVALQFKEKKGDLVRTDYTRKNNCLFAKMIYVYEGIKPVSDTNKRHELVHPHYFCGPYQGSKRNGEFWDEVYEYISNTYDMDAIKKIYLNADGGTWIKAGKDRLPNITYVMDEYHILKYMTRATAHLLDSTADARMELREALKKGRKKAVNEVLDRIEMVTDNEITIRRVEDCRTYFITNLTAIAARLNKEGGIKGCSAEGHVSHVLSSRMSSRPMGWSIKGADAMSHLRAYHWNGGDMLTLVREQKQEFKKAAGAEYDILSCSEIKASEHNKHVELGKYVESISHTAILTNKKAIGFYSKIFNL